MNVEKISKEVVSISSEKICEYLNIGIDRREELLQNFLIESKFSGHNNEIVVIGFYSAQKILLGKVCFKYASGQGSKLELEGTVLSVLTLNQVSCPITIDGVFTKKKSPHILMEVLDGILASESNLDIQGAGSVLEIILLHESVLLENLEVLQLVDKSLNLLTVIDFEKKLTNYLKDFAPHFRVKISYNFLNSYLNNMSIVKRSVVTDRSADNMFIGENNKITMIDFSTLRIGTQFDNWIQFIEDPRARFSCSKGELIKLFFKRKGLAEKEIDTYYVASIYTNLLQGIFTHKKNPELSAQYVNTANDSFEKFNKKKGVLIDISH